MVNSMQLIDGELMPVEEVCMEHALKTYRQRRHIDSNPKIVRMVVAGEALPHWYYRSNEFIDQPYDIADRSIHPYVGPAVNAPLYLYGEQAYMIEPRTFSLDSLTDNLIDLLIIGLSSMEDD